MKKTDEEIHFLVKLCKLDVKQIIDTPFLLTVSTLFWTPEVFFSKLQDNQLYVDTCFVKYFFCDIQNCAILLWRPVMPDEVTLLQHILYIFKFSNSARI